MFEFKKTGQQQKQRFRLRAWVGGVFALACFGVLVGRFWYLQVDRYEGLSERADRNRIAVVPIPPRRGEILDRNGEVLARNYRTYTLEVVPAQAGNMNALFERLTQVVYISPADQRRFKRRAAESSRYASLQLRNNLNETEAAWFGPTPSSFQASNCAPAGCGSIRKAARPPTWSATSAASPKATTRNSNAPASWATTAAPMSSARRASRRPGKKRCMAAPAWKRSR